MSVADMPPLVDNPDAEVRDDGRVWISREKMLETTVEELTAERDFLRETIRALTSNQDRDPASKSKEDLKDPIGTRRSWGG